MRFVRAKTLAGELRGQMIAEALGVPCDDDYQTPDTVVVFVKKQDGIQQAAADGCIVAYDPVDYFCYADQRPYEPLPEVSVLIVPNKRCCANYRKFFPSADFLVVPHQWDPRITGECEHDEFRPGYVGRSFNIGEDIGIPMVTDAAEQLSALPRFNCHLSNNGRTSLHAERKPATKVASAAAVGAVVLCQRDASSERLLGDDYPFYSDGTLFDGLWQARKRFGTAAWDEAREIMRGVKEKTSLPNVAALYEVFRCA